MRIFFLLFIAAVFFVSCTSKFGKILKSTDYDYKLKKADEYFAKKKYKNAEQLYIELFPVFKGTEKFEDLYYKYAFCSYYQKNYTDAENLFKGFLDVFPNSPKAEEIAYLHAYTFYLQSPKIELEQVNTAKAIGMMQTFINNHPNSSRIKEATDVIEASRAKLEIKEYRNANLYYNLQQYRAAGVRITFTSAPALTSSRTNITALYAAMLPVTPNNIFFPENIFKRKSDDGCNRR